MNILASYRYQMADHKKLILIFYLVIVVLFILIGVTTARFVLQDSTNTDGSNIISGIEMPTVIFLFVVGLCTFKETFLMSLQNGISRQTVFISKLLTIASVAGIMALADKIIYLIATAFIKMADGRVASYTFYETLYPARSESVSAIQLQAESFIFEFLMALAVMAIGYSITIMFYRLNKTGKVIVGVGVPVLLFMVIPFLDVFLFNGAIDNAIGQAIYSMTCSPSRMFISSLLAFVFFSALAFVLMRRAVVKR